MNICYRVMIVLVTTFAWVIPGCNAGQYTSEPVPTPGDQQVTTVPPYAVPAGTLPRDDALSALNGLVIAPEGTQAGYDRDCGSGHACSFGPAWSDDVRVAGGHNGCRTRDDILRRDLTDVRSPDGCVVTAGELLDPYTGQTIAYQRGESDVDIDHVVALAQAWRSGAAGWDPDQRRDLANDPRNLLAVEAGVNRSKGDDDAGQWLPPNAEYRCTYALIVTTVKALYRLTVDAQEMSMLRSEVETCPRG